MGPLTFAFVALTSLMLLNFIAKQLGELVGKGLPWSIVGEFFLLSLPLTVALTVPMSVLVAVLYAYSRLASENEVTALKASGVSPFRLVSPAIGVGLLMSAGMLVFNDQVLPRSNHQLKTLQEDISQTKPTLLLKEQVINTIAEGKFYLKAGKIDQSLGRMQEVVIYDLSNPQRRRTIYADSGKIAFAANKVDIDMDLFHGQMQEISSDKATQLNRLFYAKDRIKVRDVGRDFKQSAASESSKGDREMGVCEMQKRLWVAESYYQDNLRSYKDVVAKKAVPTDQVAPLGPPKVPQPRGLGWLYCGALNRAMAVKEAHAADVHSAHLHSASAQQDSVTRRGAGQDSVTRRGAGQDTTKKGDSIRAAQPAVPVFQPSPGLPAGAQPVPAVGGSKTQEQIAAEAAASLMNAKAAVAATPTSTGLNVSSAIMEASMRLKMAERQRDRYEIEINKKFSLAAACIIFCLLAPPIALRFPRGGVGLVIGVSLAVFALYYVGLIGGEAAANHGYLEPVWAMWAANLLMMAVGVVMLVRLRSDFSSSRGGGIREWLDTRKLLREEARRAAATP